MDYRKNPRNVKPKVRFAFIPKVNFPYVSCRMCLTYKHKRLFYTEADNGWSDLDAKRFKSDGTLCDKSGLSADLLLLHEYQSEYMLWLAKGAISIADEASKRGVWDKLTSRDFASLLGMWCQCNVATRPESIYRKGQKFYIDEESHKESLRIYSALWDIKCKGWNDEGK